MGQWNSKLQPYKEEILSLWFERKTLKDIVKILEEEHSLEISPQGLHRFIKIRLSKDDPHERPKPVTAAKISKPGKTDDPEGQKAGKSVFSDMLSDADRKDSLAKKKS